MASRFTSHFSSPVLATRVDLAWSLHVAGERMSQDGDCTSVNREGIDSRDCTSLVDCVPLEIVGAVVVSIHKM